MDIPKRHLGKTGAEVTIFGLGGEGVLRTQGNEQEAYRLINRAIDLGLNYFESARAYSGSESYYGLALKESETLRNMGTDHLDLWQVHDVRTEADIAEIFGPNGAIEAFEEAKAKGSTRFVGVTGHHDPQITLRCLEMYPFDTVLMPVNPGEPLYKSFLEVVMPVAIEKGMGVVAMKIYFRGLAARIPEYKGMAPFFRFALSQPVSTAVIGCDDVIQLEENVAFARSFEPMSEEEMEDLQKQVAPFARELMYYKP